jgi:hypothetical protein
MAGHKTDLGVDVGFPQPDEMPSFFGIDKEYGIVSVQRTGMRVRKSRAFAPGFPPLGGCEAEKASLAF